MSKKKRNAYIIATAIMAVLIIVGGTFLMTTEYWVCGYAFAILGILWIWAFIKANFEDEFFDPEVKKLLQEQRERHRKGDALHKS